MKTRTTGWLIAVAMLSACGGENTSSTISVPGGDETTKTKALEIGANLLQDKAPLGSLNAYLDGFHFYSGDPQAQMEAHHYCGHLNEDMIQCVIFDANDENAKIVGVEYIVSRALFEKLPVDEKHLWHSHVHEVRSGSLIAPGIPEVAEYELMEKIAGTYGKTWHTWHMPGKGANAVSARSTGADGSILELPTGTPMLMMGFVDSYPADSKMVLDRDRRFEISSERKKAQRADIQYPPIDPEADAWQKGIAPQLELKNSGAQPTSSANQPH
jgi:hypothetical protein